MNVCAAVSVAASVVGLAVSALAFGIARAPRFDRYRELGAVALMAAFFTMGELPQSLVTNADIIMPIARVQSVFAALHVLCWRFYADRHLGRKPGRGELGVRVAFLLMASGWLVPGAMYHLPLSTFALPWLGCRETFPQTTTLGSIAYLCELSMLVWTLTHYVRAWRQGVYGAKGHVAAIAAMLLAAVNDVAVTLGAYEGPFLLSTGFLVALVSLGVLLARDFMREAEELDRLKQQLEQRVAERTAELVMAEAALMRSEKLAAIGQLSAGVAHEINNPAAVVRANLEWLKDELSAGIPARGGGLGDASSSSAGMPARGGGLGDASSSSAGMPARGGGLGDEEAPSEAVSAIDDSLEAIDRVAKIVRQLLDLGRATSSGSGSTMLRHAVDRAFAMAKTSLRSDIAVEIDVPDSLCVGADEASVGQILVNLVVNGAHAIPKTRAGKLRVVASEVGSEIHVKVIDDGTGMSEETRKRAFEPFFTTKPFGEGTGLGLALSLGITRSLGGRLECESRPGETVMTLTLPSAVTAEKTVERRAGTSARRSLLLVEDDDRVRRALARMLAAPFTLEVATGVDEALARLERGPFDIVLSDWRMPAGGGRRLYEEATTRWPALAAAFMFVTGGGLSGDDTAFLKSHVVLEKPLSLEKLQEAVTQRLDASAES